MAADAPGEPQVRPLLLGRRAAGDDLHRLAGDQRRVAVLDEQAARHLRHAEVARRAAALAVLQDAHVGLAREDLQRVLLVAGREQDLDELLGERLGGRRVDRAG